MKIPKNDRDENDSISTKISIINLMLKKTSLVNRILGENIVKVIDITRTILDTIVSGFENELGKFFFINSEGIRRKNKVKEKIEKSSVMRTLLKFEDFFILMIDVNEKVTE